MNIDRGDIDDIEDFSLANYQHTRLAIKPVSEHIALLCEAYDFAQFSTIEQLNQLPKPVFDALHILLAEIYRDTYEPST